MAVMVHHKTMGGTRASAVVNMSRVEEEHAGTVRDAVWAASGTACISAGADGRVKIWAVSRFRCVWTSEATAGVDSCVKVVEDLTRGIVVAAMESGAVVVYSGFDLEAIQIPGAIQPFIKQIRIVPALAGKQEVQSLFLDPVRLTILVGFANSTSFYRHNVDLFSNIVEYTAFGDSSCGSIRTIAPAFTSSPNERPYILAGDSLGSIALYDWSATTSSSLPPASPLKRVEVFSEATVTTIASNAYVIAVGSSRGSIRILDALTFELLRAFAPPLSTHQDVGRILLGRDMLVGSVGSAAMAWRAGAVDSRTPNWKSKGKAKFESDRKAHSKLPSTHLCFRRLTSCVENNTSSAAT